MAGLWRERVRGGSATRKKTTVARPNEDAVLYRVADGLIGVFDGIGMYAEARLASQIARQLCTTTINRAGIHLIGEQTGVDGKPSLAQLETGLIAKCALRTRYRQQGCAP